MSSAPTARSGSGSSSGRMAGMTSTPLRLTGDPEADQLLTDDDNALLIGMVLDQQVG